jgi:hypothetical protein
MDVNKDRKWIGRVRWCIHIQEQAVLAGSCGIEKHEGVRRVLALRTDCAELVGLDHRVAVRGRRLRRLPSVGAGGRSCEAYARSSGSASWDPEQRDSSGIPFPEIQSCGRIIVALVDPVAQVNLKGGAATT